MNTSVILEKDSNGVATLILNRPEIHHAFNEEMIQTLLMHLAELEKDTHIRLLVIKSKGKHFCAGADINWMQSMIDYSYDENYQDALKLAQLMERLAHFTKPTIALVQGASFGGGVGLVACCDIAIATDDAKFCFSEVKLGLIPAAISPYVIAAIGARQAKKLFLTGETFSAEVARSLGLCHLIVKAEELESTAAHTIQTLLNNGPLALQAAKQLIFEITHLANSGTNHLTEKTSEFIAKIRCSAEGQEGLKAFIEKRPAAWINAAKTGSKY